MKPRPQSVIAKRPATTREVTARETDAPLPASESSNNGATLATLLRGKQKFLAFVEKRVGSRAVAEDILQEAFLRSLERARTLDRELPPELPESGERATAWFYRVLRNAVIDYYRHREVEQRAHLRWGQDWEHDAGLSAGFSQKEQHEVCGCFREFLELLKPEYHRAIDAVDLRGVSLKEFAAVEKISLNNAAVRVHRARLSLRRQIERACGVCAEHGCLDCHCNSFQPSGAGQPSGARE